MLQRIHKILAVVGVVSVLAACDGKAIAVTSAPDSGGVSKVGLDIPVTGPQPPSTPPARLPTQPKETSVGVHPGQTGKLQAGPAPVATSITDLPTKISVKLVPMILNPLLVPPDPGKANNDTLLGIDSNRNGLRDDIERWIAETYPKSARLRAASAQMALYVQKVLAVGAAAESVQGAATTKGEYSQQVALEAGSAVFCYLSEFPPPQQDHLTKFYLAYLNTTPRSIDYLKGVVTMGGRAFEQPASGNGCTIQPDHLPN